MKQFYLVLLALGVMINTSAQISTFPYYETFGKYSPLTGWTVTSGTWYHDTSQGTISVVNHSQTNVHAYLYSPWINTNPLNHPIIQFDLRITDDDSTSCVPELDLGYDDSISTGFNTVQMNIASNRLCTPGLTPYYQIAPNHWVTLTFPLPWYNHMKFEFNSVFPGLGSFDIRNVYIGEQINTGIEEVQSLAVSMSPNPANEGLTIFFDAPQSGIAELYFTDLLGKTVLTIPSFAASGTAEKGVNVSGLSNGIYLLHVLMNGKHCTQKVVISH